MVYGVDAQKTQAFGNDDGVWDVTFDHGSYGWAMPQAYAEVRLRTTGASRSVTSSRPIGYEVIPATGNFFYSHAYTMFNSEPFTHTGVLGTYTASDDAHLCTPAGRSAGTPASIRTSGGSNFLGGFGLQAQRRRQVHLHLHGRQPGLASGERLLPLERAVTSP